MANVSIRLRPTLDIISGNVSGYFPFGRKPLCVPGAYLRDGRVTNVYYSTLSASPCSHLGFNSSASPCMAMSVGLSIWKEAFVRALRLLARYYFEIK